MTVHKNFSTIPIEKWQNWKWQLQNQIKTFEQLEQHIELSSEEKLAFLKAKQFFSFAVTPYYFSLIDKSDFNCPIRKQVIPRKGETTHLAHEKKDPLAEEVYMPLKGLTHRYIDRVLLYVSHRCSVYCRYCTRKRKVSKTESIPNQENLNSAIQYIKEHTKIKEVILSGGDPLNLSEKQLSAILQKLKDISHINQIRIHSRYLASLPMRITLSLCQTLKKFFPLYIVTHFNHPKECSKEATLAAKLLIQEGNCILLNQNVLLKGINDNEKILIDLYYKLIAMGIKPYYLHQCDEVFGSSDFKVSLHRGQQIMANIRGYISGINVPLYVADLTGGGGKVPIENQYFLEEQEQSYILKNYQNKPYEISK